MMWWDLDDGCWKTLKAWQTHENTTYKGIKCESNPRRQWVDVNKMDGWMDETYPEPRSGLWCYTQKKMFSAIKLHDHRRKHNIQQWSCGPGVSVSLSIPINHVSLHLERSFYTNRRSLCLQLLQKTFPHLKHFASFSPATSVLKVLPLWRIYIGTDRRNGDWQQINLLLGAFRDVSPPLVTHAARVDHCGYEKHICRPWDGPWNELTTRAVQSGGKDGNSSWPDVGSGQLPKWRPIILERTLHLHTAEG